VRVVDFFEKHGIFLWIFAWAADTESSALSWRLELEDC
jgi:hypothetical protein